MARDSVSRFVPLQLHTLPKARVYIVAQHWQHLDFTVPEGFETDGASIPRFLWSTIGSPFMPQFIEAAVLHDYLYKTGHATRAEADELFYLMLRQDGVSWVRAHVMWMAVRAFGWLFFKG